MFGARTVIVEPDYHRPDRVWPAAKFLHVKQVDLIAILDLNSMRILKNISVAMVTPRFRVSAVRNCKPLVLRIVPGQVASGQQGIGQRFVR
jgi:hypothetical protein